MADLSAPWVMFYREIKALFEDDPAIRVEYNEDEYIIKLYVEGIEKADALTQLLPATKTFGNVSIQVQVIPANMQSGSNLELFQKAFEGNPAFSHTQVGGSYLTSLFSYVVFQKKVVQFFGDNLADANGLKSTLYQEIAKDVFGDIPGIYFCTDKED